ncbi:uncharacterized protein N0V89_001882 [Didymosphaeria variabile]|uniref:MFS general substrate transporter n=1 Tax=Didymosphaeria variabile TaxID=1932322 RepID=A0A9W9CDU8_9PLEO|nr:uncharacterized protein N0V89_001882 [Didymosphaeria variabile]KAJ4357307.1 hypothetical protein N0V89_001882 [Didymosphaeria variabile]
MHAKDVEGTTKEEKHAPEAVEKLDEVLEKPDIESHGDSTGAVAKTDPEEIRLVRKIDWRLMARLNDLEEDLGMDGDTQFNTTVSILFVGYVLMQIPSNMLITRIKPGYYMSAWMLIWAVVSGCTGLVQNYAGLVLCRFFLGITEAPVSRGVLLRPPCNMVY